MRKSNLMTTGEIARKMNVSVRTVQYYDKIGLLRPSETSEGGRRLYSLKDYMLLHQIVSLKELGFTLSDIRERLMPSNEAAEIDNYLKQQETRIKQDSKMLEAKHDTINKFRQEMKPMKKLDWNLLVEILSLLRNNDENIWVVKHFDKETYSKIKDRFKDDKGEAHMKYMQNLCEEAKVLKDQEIDCCDIKSIDLVKRWWNKILEFTGGDVDMIKQMSRMTDDENSINIEFMNKYKEVEDYIGKALTYCFERGILTFPLTKEDNEND